MPRTNRKVKRMFRKIGVRGLPPGWTRRQMKRHLQTWHFYTKKMALEYIDTNASLLAVFRGRLANDSKFSHKRNAKFRRRQRRSFLNELQLRTGHVIPPGDNRNTYCGLNFTIVHILIVADTEAYDIIEVGVAHSKYIYLCPKCRAGILAGRMEKFLTRRANWEDGLLSTPESYY